jgi:hypothetical protein
MRCLEGESDRALSSGEPPFLPLAHRGSREAFVARFRHAAYGIEGEEIADDPERLTVSLATQARLPRGAQGCARRILPPNPLLVAPRVP